MTRIHRTILSVLGIICLAGMTGCDGKSKSGDVGFMYKDLPVANSSATAGKGHTVTFKGDPLKLAGPGIKVGDKLRNVKVAKGDLSLINLADTKGKVRIINVVPSLDTPVCEQQTHHLSEKNSGLDKMIELITISVDTPFAQGRFAKEAKIANVTFLSDYRGGDFGKAYGLLVEGPHILARTVMVVDKDNVIRYMQIAPELTQLPDMDAAFRAAKSLVEKS
ncbi:MAG: thiol peroxidase [Nitrospiraceae bacterium]|nr:thiol peroxidase [Nitrospiraceae bacterium]MSR25021.1 thiol peroxidase [Nitrospiraceae bacterium]